MRIDADDTNREAGVSLLELRGIGKDTYAALGGGNEYVRMVRADFERSAVAQDRPNSEFDAQ